MGIENLAFGNQMFPDAPFAVNGAGLRSAFGLQLQGPGQVVAFVRATPMLGNVPPEIETKRVNTLAQGLKLCRPGMGDTVIVLPGHSETFVDATVLANLVEGSRIIGIGNPDQDDSPTLILAAAAAQFAINKKNVTIAGMRLLVDGFNGVVKAINITAAGVKLIGNFIRVAQGAALKTAWAIDVGAGAHQCSIIGNKIVGTPTHALNDGILVSAAVDDVDISGNFMQFSAAAVNGCVRVNAAALRIRISNNEIYNTNTASTACIAFGAFASDGMVCFNSLATLNNGNANAQGIVAGATSLVKCFQNFSADEPRASGVIAPAVAAT